MQLQIIVLRDICADAYGIPSFQPTIGGSIRAFQDEINRKDPQNMLSMHPEHFELYHVGTYSDGDCNFNLFAKPKQIAVGADYVNPIDSTSIIRKPALTD